MQVLIGLFIYLFIFLWTELGRTVDEMNARAKRICVLMIKVNNLFSFFSSRFFEKK